MHKLSPSDFAYLYEECKLCYYLKVKHNIYQPSMPMPGVFSAINTRLQTPLVGKNLHSLSEDLPDAKVTSQEGWVESIPAPDTDVYIKGKYDLLAESSDGSFVLVDLKISQPHEDKAEIYKSQLAAYKFALENPVHGKGVKISQLGLLIFYPDKVALEKGIAKFDFPATWLEVPANEKEFIKLTKEIDTLLHGPMPKEGKECKWCRYRHAGETLSHKDKVVQTDLPF